MRTFGVVAVVITATDPAEAADADGSQTQLWLRYQYQHGIGKRVRGFGMLRYEDVLSSGRLFGSQTRLALTGGASFSLRERIRLEGGLGLYETFRPDLADLFETRLWQAATLDWPDSPGRIRRYVVHHRFMIEERFKETGEWSFALRLRYRVAFSVPINRYTVEAGALYAPLAAEFFLSDDRESREVYTERQRFTAGLGYVLDRTWTLEARYTAQLSRDTIDGSFRVADHIVDVRLKTSLRIRDLVKSR